MKVDPDSLGSYAAETTPADDAVQRVIAGARGRAAPRRTAPIVGGVLALAAVVVAAVTWPREPGPVAPAPPVSLASVDAPRVADAGSGITLTYQGSGELVGDQLAWETGEVSVEVPPDQGLHFAVTTREGEARVVGTGFTVSRDVLGTRVAVRHGRVAVACASAPAVVLGAGEARVCLPVSAPSLLARARALRAASAPDSEIEATLDAGLALAGPSGAGADELRYLRADIASASGATAAAVADLDLILQVPTSARRGDALRMRAGIAVGAGDCPSALPWLDELISGEPRAVDLVLRATCSGPAEAKSLLQRAIVLEPSGPTADRAREALENLRGR